MRIFKNLFPRLSFKIHDVFIKNIFIMGNKYNKKFRLYALNY